MKKILLAFLLLAGCAKHDPAPVYTGLDGNWKFSSVDVSGELTLSQGKVTGGFFVLSGGTRYTVDTPYTYTVPNDIDLVSGKFAFVFRDVHPAPDYKTILSHSYDYYVGSGDNVVTRDITIVRK